MRTTACFTFVLFCFVATALAAEPAKWGDFKVKFVYDGEPPVRREIVAPNAPPGFGPLFDEALIVNHENRGIANVIVWLEAGRQVLPVHESFQKSSQDVVTVKVNDSRYQPHVTIFRTSQTLEFASVSAIGHNPNIAAMDNSPRDFLLRANEIARLAFPKAERLPVRTGDNIHSWFSGYVLIKDHPYAAVSDNDGVTTIKNLPIGKRQFQMWHEAGGYVRLADHNGQPAEWPKGILDVTLVEGENNLGVVKFKPDEQRR